jgi:hypothetical protein
MKKSAAFLAGAMVVAAASPAAALGLNYGVRAGYGIGMPDPDDGVDSASVIDAGLAVMLDLAILGLEVDLLYNRQTTKFKGGGEANVGNIAIPILARGSFPVIPMFLSLDFGGGLEPRFPISAEADIGGKTVDFKDDMESMPLYLPIFIGTTLDIKLVKLNLDIRYERQLTASSKTNEDARFHELVFMAGGFF